MINTEQIEAVVKKLKTRKSKNIIYLIVVLVVVGCFSYRFNAVKQENNVNVFNIARNNLENGLPVKILKAEQSDGILYEPLTIRNNRAYVSGARVKIFKSGQKIDNCKIVSVSNNLDLDTGMFVIKTSGCSDGMKLVENKKHGFFVPASAVSGNTVFVADGDVAHVRNVVIGGRDAQNVLIISGLENGENVILSNVSDNQKIKIEQ